MEKFKLNIGNKDLVVEIRNLAEQANGSCLVSYGDTMVLATAVMSKQNLEGKDFFPLTVEYEERYYAAGKILGSRFIRRESRPSDEAVLSARAIDRAIRPRFPQNLNREVQVVVTCLSWDGQNDPDLIGLLAASLSLSMSDIPWSGPLGNLRIGRIDKEFVLNPTYEEREKSDLDLVLAAVEKKGEILINMIEMEGNEIEEEVILKACKFAQPHFKKLIDFQKEIIKKVGKEKEVLPEGAPDLDLEREMKEFLGDKLEKALYQKNKSERAAGVDDVKAELVDFVESKYPAMGKSKTAKGFLEKETEKLVHENIIKKDLRPDGRKLDEVRQLEIEAGLLPRAHGSGLFIRGETKALSILTLGAPADVRLLEGMEIRGKKRFMHHYNFPPYCSGEIKPMRGPGRREIGHGMLAERALLPLVPNFEEFPYTMRVVTEILSSNGSTSMASVSAASLALMDAGVPIKKAAAGIAVGLIMDENGNYKVLADIQGPEDHYGDMDLKAAGTKDGLTAIQMDVKIEGITEKILKDALDMAKKSRGQILDEIEKVLQKPRPELSPWAPRIYTLQIKPDKIREVIGPGGKIIHEIIEKCEVAIDIEDSGLVFITAEKDEAAKKAVSWIENITHEVKVGEIFQGKVKRILNFGAFVEILPGQEGMVHISQLAPYRVGKVEDIVKIGDIVPVKVIAIDEQGRINLSIKEAKNGRR
ncbi:MAG: polyribonucleotide nucleotidyltransferase [Candidatus Nealsonbacteria bacterium CG09_land_8_20_14_0_10_42_14]|uniref:Polyribonucleotide nucleotidyltransferase n=1 Tax=Candidatus Nealsonbacteria bacterium CG09_land_8_20_14_0_10_42_14 TaxID=1974707 RepID=A0A2H0WX15_9BACT|nr:MAG: polyribonucleotide nucleotidyltransferase [Candidatus Nealsonbacteria bacterium CG09_land_8_20_14_0_10_42_14]